MKFCKSMFLLCSTENSPQNYPFWIFDWIGALDPPFSNLTTHWHGNILRQRWTALLLCCLLQIRRAIAMFIPLLFGYCPFLFSFFYVFVILSIISFDFFSNFSIFLDTVSNHWWSVRLFCFEQQFFPSHSKHLFN